MKNTLTFLFLLYFSFCYTQNWSPISLNEKFNYQIDTAAYISNTLWVDSTSVINTDSVFYLNRIVSDCLECPWEFDPLIDFKLANQSQFLQERIIKQETGVYTFEGNRNFTLRTLSGLGESWLFDTLNNITATVDDIYEEEILGEMDSLKVIQLSNDDEIWLSKNHGILQFKEAAYTYELRGIEERGLGESVPDFWDFYNLDVGDVYQYRHRSSNGVGDQWTTIDKYEILSKQVNATNYVYEVHRVRTTHLRDFTGTSTPISSFLGLDTIVFTQPAADYYTERYNRSLVGDLDEAILFSEFEIKNYIGIYKDPVDQRVVKKTGNPFPYERDRTVSYYHITDPDQPEIDSDTLTRFFFYDNLYYEYKEEIGLIYSEVFYFETTEVSELLGYVKGVDTVGIVEPDTAIFVVINSIAEPPNTEEIQFTIYPNPSVDGVFNISSPGIQDVQVEVYTIKGELVYKMPQTSGNFSIDLSKQPPGTYVARLSNPHFKKSYRLVKQRDGH